MLNSIYRDRRRIDGEKPFQPLSIKSQYTDLEMIEIICLREAEELETSVQNNKKINATLVLENIHCNVL